MTGNYITTDSIIEKVQRSLPTQYKLSIEEVVEYIYDCIRIIGGRNSSFKGTVKLQVSNNKTKIPAYIENIESVWGVDKPYINIQFIQVGRVKELDKATYSIQDGYLYTSIVEGNINVNITTFPVDEQDKPMIPANVFYEKAVISYITERIMYKLYLQDIVSERKYELVRQDWYYYKGNARTSSLMLTESEEMDFNNQTLRLIPKLHRGLARERRIPLPEADLQDLNDLMVTQKVQ